MIVLIGYLYSKQYCFENLKNIVLSMIYVFCRALNCDTQFVIVSLSDPGLLKVDRGCPEMTSSLGGGFFLPNYDG